MIESVQVRQRGAFDFETHYDNLCALQDSCPLPAVKAHLSQGVLDLNGDRIRANDWMPILNTLRINKSLEFVAVRSYYTPSSDDNEKKALIEKRKTPSVRSKEITYRMCKALKECLGVTPTLTCLELQGLPLRERDLNTLMKGLVKNNTLSHFSLEFCRIGDTGLDILCKGMKNSASINSVNFTGCSLSWKGADSLAKVIKHQAMRRHNEAWRDSLRYRRPDLDRMPGIRRITINNNPMMGDQGAVLLAEALKDDLWLKALDMQGNGISSTGAKSLLDVLKYNTTLVVLDVRRNPLIDRDLVHAIMEQLMINCNGQDTEYKWIKAEESGDVKGRTPKKRTKTLNSSFGRKTTIRITAGAARRRTRSAESIGVSRKMKPISSEGVKAGPGMPWRTAARANRYRGYPPEHIPGQSSLLENSENLSPHGTPNQSGVTVTMEGSEGSEGEEDEDTIGELQKLKLDDSALTTQVNSQKNLRIEVQQLRRQMQEERLARHKAEQRVVELTLDNKKVREENSRLKRTKGSILDDDSVLESIEASFKQFHEFLDLLRDAGLGQLITMAGLDAKGSPFVQQQPSSKFDADPNANFPKTNGKSQVFLGDISGSSRINGSFVGSGKAMNGNLRTKSYFNSNDGTMSSFLDDSNDNLKARHDDLYERILERTNGVFNPDVTVDVTVDSTRTADDDDNNRLNETDENVKKDEKTMKGKEISVGKNLAVSESYDSLRGPGGEIIMSLSPFEDEEEEKQGKVNQNGKKDDISERVDSPDKGQGRTSRVSDFSYGMDSFEQSYISERGEVVHLGDDVDFYPESPSPIGQASDEEDF